MLVRIETSPDDFHGMAVAQGILTARGGATSHAAVVARQIGKPCVAGCHELVIDYGARTATANGVTFAEGDPDQPRRLDRRGLRRRAADRLGAVRGPAGAPDHPRLGRRGPPDGGLDQRRQARRGGDGPDATAPRGSACAAPSTCSARASGSRSCVARSSWRWSRRGPRPRRAAGATLSVDEAEAVDHVRCRDGEARGPPAGRLRGHLPGDGRAAGRHPAASTRRSTSSCRTSRTSWSRSPGPRRPAARPRRTASCWPRSRACTSRTRCSGCAAAAWG